MKIGCIWKGIILTCPNDRRFIICMKINNINLRKGFIIYQRSFYFLLLSLIFFVFTCKEDPTSSEGSSENYALQFDGIDDYVEIPSSLIFNEITFSAWVKIEDVAINNRRIFTIDGVDPDYHYFDLEGTSKNTLAVNVDGDNFMDYDWPLIPNSWTHVSVSYDGSNVKIYKDGVNIETGIINASPRTGIQYIGGINNPNYSDAWDGIIDEVRIWNIIRTQVEIQADMYREISGNESGLVGYWRFNEGSGNTAFDQIANGNDGSLQGGVTWVISSAPISSSD